MTSPSEVVSPAVEAAMAQAKSEVSVILDKVDSLSWETRERIIDELVTSRVLLADLANGFLGLKHDKFCMLLKNSLESPELTVDGLNFLKETLQRELQGQEHIINEDQEEQMSRKVTALTDLINASFQSYEIDTMVFDLAQSIYQQFARGSYTSEKIVVFLQHCFANPKRIKKLLEYIEDKNPVQYSNHYQSLKLAGLGYLDL